MGATPKNAKTKKQGSSSSSMEGKVIKEEILGSPSVPPSPETNNIPTVVPNSNSANNSTQAQVPSGKENRRLLTSPSLNTEILTRSRSKGLTKDNSHHHHHHPHHRMSESPKMVGIGSHLAGGGSSSSSSSQHSPTVTTVTKNSHGNKTFSHSFSSPHSSTTVAATNGATSGVNARHVTSPSPSPTGSTNGTHNGGGRTPSSGTTSNNAGSSNKSEQLGSSTSRLIVKIKRFLGTLLHFGCDISPEVGDRVRCLVFNLVSGHLTIEDFHQSLQEVTSFPLRPFVIPFLKAHLPLLQREISHLARISKQSPLSFVRTHEQVIVESGSSPGEPCDIFHSEAGESLALISGSGKRKSESMYENGDGGGSGGEQYTSTPKRFNGGALFSPPFFLSNLGGATTGLGPSSSSSVVGPADLRDYYSSAVGYHLLTSQFHSSIAPDGPPPSSHPTTSTPLPTNSNGMSTPSKGGPDEEWRNIHVMLNCILSMVDKTKRALTILQTRTFHNEGLEATGGVTSGSSGSSSGSGSWLRRPGGSGFNSVDSSDEFKRHAGEVMAQALRVTEDRVAEVKRRAEDAVLEVKRQAVAEVQRAVAAAEARAYENFQRAKLERAVIDLRRNGENIGPVDSETCWNCGRKAHETCSGCNTARYCSSFCQHKDWEQHHNSCGRTHSSSTSSDRGGDRGDRDRSMSSGSGGPGGQLQSELKAHHSHAVHSHRERPPSENSNSPINVSHPSPDNRSSGSRSN